MCVSLPDTSSPLTQITQHSLGMNNCQSNCLTDTDTHTDITIISLPVTPHFNLIKSMVTNVTKCSENGGKKYKDQPFAKALG